MFVNLHGGKENAVLGGLQRLEMRSKLLVVKLHKSGEATQLSRTISRSLEYHGNLLQPIIVFPFCFSSAFAVALGPTVHAIKVSM